MNIGKVKIEIWSDITCPFCFIGKKKMEKTIAKLNAQDRVEILWHSFLLEPDFPRDTAISSIKLAEKKGYSLEQIKYMGAQFASKGKEYNIDFQYEKALKFNTMDAHRLIHWSKTLNKSNTLKEAFMVAYFTDGINLSQQENILKIINKIGLDTIKAKEIINSDAFTQEVDQDLYQARQLSITGVPYFLINEKEVIAGAPEDKVFEKALSSALKKSKQQAGNASQGGICSPNGECR